MAWLLALLLCVQGVVASDCLAQSQTAKGNVVSKADGQPLPGVNVVVKGTTTGTITDFDGNFSLSVDNGQTLVFSFLGFKNQEVVFAGQPINVSRRSLPTLRTWWLWATASRRRSSSPERRFK